jgi:toxin ParE1/3/4
MKLEFSPLARQDLLDIFHYIAADKPQAAVDFIQELEQRCQLLPNFPNLGTALHHVVPLLRLLVVRGYGIYFRPLENVVRIERILSPGRLMTSTMIEP